MKRKAVVVGGGFAGLSGAAYLARDGWDVTLVEKNEKIGGYLISIPIFIGLILSFLLAGEMLSLMLFPLIIGMLYLTVYYRK